MDTRKEFELLTRQTSELRFQFIINELDLAITFCQLAASTSDSSKARRNAEHARRACREATRFIRDNLLTAAMNEEIHARLARLREQFSGVDLE